MKIASNLSAVIDINEKKINTIAFEDTYQCNEFIRNLLNYLCSKEDGDDLFSELIDEDISTVNVKSFHSIVINCGTLDLISEKQMKDALLKRIESDCRGREDIGQVYEKIEREIGRLASLVKIDDEQYQIELDETQLQFKQFLKLFKIDVHNNFSNLSAVQARKVCIDLMKDKKKENILFLLFPEANLGVRDMKNFLNMVRSYQMTTIIVTNHPYFMVEADNLAMSKRNMTLFDLNEVREEFKLLFPEDDVDERIIKQIAINEFMQSHLIKDERYIKFINSY
ncbi:hypothetical protein ERX27_03630 [Macrococcus brunensis]|uniref:ABC transporter ATP-binding protein n=1 Tax=Macrococcus brunensis TaxID=198483 RepID=A0A4R6BEJ0_9STAP|nr:hypothetical protein [Macrococcus brunensis]TDL98240.1 hypothetical protein ERX27_03630 [Macrococcus brunensis]